MHQPTPYDLAKVQPTKLTNKIKNSTKNPLFRQSSPPYWHLYHPDRPMIYYEPPLVELSFREIDFNQNIQIESRKKHKHMRDDSDSMSDLSDSDNTSYSSVYALNSSNNKIRISKFYNKSDDLSKLELVIKYLKICSKCKGKNEISTPKQADFLKWIDKNVSKYKEFKIFQDKNAIREARLLLIDEYKILLYRNSNRINKIYTNIGDALKYLENKRSNLLNLKNENNNNNDIRKDGSGNKKLNSNDNNVKESSANNINNETSLLKASDFSKFKNKNV